MTPGFSLVNQSASVSNDALEAIAEALGLYWLDLREPWDLPLVSFAVQEASKVRSDWVRVLFTDTVDTPDDYAFHEETNQHPDIVIQVPVYADSGILFPGTGHATCLSIGVAHEVAETACDPLTNLVTPYGPARSVAFEICDPFQDNWYSKNTSKGPVAVSDFALPTWFDPDATAGPPQDFMKLCTTPGRIVNGYAVVYDASGNGSEVFGERLPNAAVRAASARRKVRLGRTVL